jgi:hypothetical protein
MKMISPEFSFQIGIALMSILALVCLFALFQAEVERIFSTIYHVLIRPITLINDFLGAFWQGVRRFYRDQFSEKKQLDLKRVFFQFIGSVLYSVFFIAFNYSEMHLLALSLAALGIDTAHYSSPMGAGTLTAIAIIFSFLFWGTIFLDLRGVTNTAPWRDALNKKWRRYLLCVTIFCLALSLFIVGLFGLLRHLGLADVSYSPQSYSLESYGGLSDSSQDIILSHPPNPEKQAHGTIDKLYIWIPIITGVCIPILVGIGGVFAGWGIIILIKFIMLAVGFLIISPLGLLYFVSILLLEIVQRLLDFVYAVIQLLIALGNRFLGIFRRRSQGENAPPTPPDDDERVAEASIQQADQIPSANEEPMRPSEEGWSPITKKGD